MGYLNNEKATMDCFDSQGFYHTGDSGYFDAETGDLALAGRIKELIITSGGENVAPLPIELSIKDACSLISNCVVVGDGERYLSALLTLRVTVNRATGRMTNELSPDAILFLLTKLESKARTVDECRTDKKVINYIQ
jgi:long-chain-fatty-acid--CoA ligase ACSBG